MDWPPFYRTMMGRQYYEKTIPDLIRQLERLSDILEHLIGEHGSSQPPRRRPDDE